MQDKFEQMFPIEMHIKMVQEGHLMLIEEKKKALNNVTFVRKCKEMAEMKFSLMKRLNNTYSGNASWFPFASHVAYIHPKHGQKEYLGTVVRHDIQNNKVICYFPKEEMEVSVDPDYLKLRYIREAF